MAVIDETPLQVAGTRTRSRRRLYLALAATVLVVAGGAVTATAVSFHYLHATPLDWAGSAGWTGPDEAVARDVHAGQYSASVVAPRYGQRQTFEVDLINPSDVSQTVLGLTDGDVLGDPRSTEEPETLQISTTRVFPTPASPLRYTSEPVTMPPRSQYRLRFTQLTSSAKYWSCGRSAWVDELSLQVRVGAFTRTEHVAFGGMIMEIRSAKPAC